MIAALLAQFSLTEGTFWVLRVVAGVGGAFVGWFLTDPLARLLHRLITKKPIPGWALPWFKLAGAIVVGLLVFFLIPLGGGPGGLGWGPGEGGGAGLGPGPGGKHQGAITKPAPEKTGETTKKPDPTTPKTATREVVEIELLGGQRFPGGGRFYLLKRTGPPQTIDDVAAYFHKHKDAIEVHLVLTDESVGLRHPAVTRLRDLASEHRIPVVEPQEKMEPQMNTDKHGSEKESKQPQAPG